MGAWGMGVFDDDTSCDLIYEIIESDAFTFISNAIKHKDSDYLEYEECHEVIVAGAVLDNLLNGTCYAHNSEDFDDWLTKQDRSKLAPLKAEVCSCLSLVLSDKSELNELWEENEEDYPEWKKNILNIGNNIGT